MGWIFLVILIVILGVGAIVTRTQTSKARRLERFTRGVTLPPTEVALTMLSRRLSRSDWGILIGGLPGFAVLIGMQFSGTRYGGLSTTAVIASLVLAGGALGAAIACTTNIGPSAPELPRVARATRPRMTDYLSPVWIVIGIVVAVTGIVVAILVLLGNAANASMRSLLTVIIAVAAVMLVASPVLAYRLLSSPQPANDDLQLAWDDALRAYGLRSVWLACSAMGIATALFAINLLYPGASALGAIEYIFCFAGLYTWDKLTRPRSRFQRRLWPTTPQPAVGSYAA
ncbi:hypothetical protein [Parafrigoribacterium soli]|uniref:hypothetical protein n=1 Tax=Parafrigoribacterium soli TaxID=3144663 RepID=UPI0032F083D6